MKRTGKTGARTRAKTGTSRKSAPARASLKMRTRSKPASTKTAKKRSRKAAARGSPTRALLFNIQSVLFNRRFVRALLLVIGCVAGGAAVGAGAKAGWSWVTHSSRLAIKQIVVRTGPRVPEQEVRTLADLGEGDNILGFRLSDCVEAIEIHPWIKRASVMRELPDRVLIEIKEREPVAMMALGPVYYVDHDGEIFKKVLAGEGMDYPVLTGITLLEVLEEKERVDSLVRLGLNIIGLARDSLILPAAQISEINLDRAFGATLVRTSDAMRIRFGRGDFEDKWSRMERTLVELSGETNKVYELDLNYEGRVTVRLREGYRVASAGSK